MDVPAALRQARYRAGLSQVDLALRTGTSQATISAYESGRKQPTVDTLARLLGAMGRRLSVESRSAAVKLPSEAQHARTARTLLEVLGLAEALPTRHEPALRYPRLPEPDGPA